MMQKLPTGVRRRKAGLLEKRFSVNGIRYSVYGKTLRQLSMQEQKKRNQIAITMPLNPKSMTTDQYFEIWLEGKKMSVKPSTIRVYTTYYKPYASPFIGSLQLSEITRRDILQVQCEAAKKLCPTTNNILLTVIKIILNEAVEDKLIRENPAKGVKPVKVTEKAAKTYHRALTEAEQKKFMDADVRDIPMNEGIKKLLKQQREKQENRIRSKNSHQDPKEQILCFPSPTGHMIGHGSVNKNIRRILCKLEEKGIHIEPFTSHALRDTFATRYIEQGGNPQTLKTILGHSSLSMTMDLYSHVMPNTRQEEMNRIAIKI